MTEFEYEHEETRIDVVYLGRKIGTASGWDIGGDPWDLQFNDVESDAGNFYSLCFFLQNGVIESYDEHGNCNYIGDIITFVSNFPPAEKADG